METRTANYGSAESSLPFELAEAARNNPVTLYSGAKCAPCDDGRQFLKARGIPFSEKTVTTNEDYIRLRQLAGNGTLPLLVVGREKQAGYESGIWGGMLTVAGYPEVSKLPATYSHAAAEPITPVVKPADKPREDQATGSPEALPPAIGNAPPGFRF